MNTFWKAFVGLLLIGVVVSLVTLFNDSEPVGSENLVGLGLPDFAAPLASGTLEGDSNIYTPAQAKAAKSVAACDVELFGAFVSCRDLKDKAVLLFWNSTKDECVDQVTTLDRFARANPAIDTVAISIDQKESVVREFVAGKQWKLPIAIDRDGAVAGLYAVAGCPSTFFVDRGAITGVKLGVLSAGQLAAGVKVTSESSGETGSSR